LPHDGNAIDVEILLVDPSETDLEALKALPLTEVEKQLKPYLRIAGIAKVIIKCEHGALIPLYALRADSVPVMAGNTVMGRNIAEIPRGFSVVGSKD
jgi:hypothetical protein